MKYVIMTSPNNQEISEVFYSVTLPIDLAPSDLIARWDKLVENSPITVVFDEEPTRYSLLIDGEITSVLTLNDESLKEKLTAGFSNPVIIKSVSEGSDIDLGYLWNGSEFLAPEIN